MCDFAGEVEISHDPVPIFPDSDTVVSLGRPAPAPGLAGRVGVVARAVTSAKGGYDYDLVIIGCGVGGHGAALHAVEQVGGALKV